MAIQDDILEVVWLRAECESGRARQVRDQHRLSLAESGAVAGVTGTTIARWERGDRIPRGTPAVRYARFLRALGKRDILAAGMEAS